MPAPSIAKSKRFYRPEITKVLFVETIVATTYIPTRAEINAGTDLSDELVDNAGWQVTTARIATPDWGRRFVSQISGRDQVEDSSLTLYQSEDGDEIETLLARGTEGFIIWMDRGDTPTQPMDVFPVEVSSLQSMRTSGDEAARVMVQFAITDAPAEQATIPAAT